MTLIKSYFGKEAEQIKYTDIEHYFHEPKEESDKIEFKSIKELTTASQGIYDKILSTICGFLNSSGGILVWGSPEGQKVPNKKEKVFQGSLTATDEIIEKDSFINKVTDLITPTPSQINFYSLFNGVRYIYLIEVAASNYSPHQYKNYYYMRIDAQTRVAPHHYIEALFKKITFPVLEGYMKPTSFIRHGPDVVFKFRIFIQNVSKLQNEKDLYFSLLTNAVFSEYTPMGINSFYSYQGKQKTVQHAKATLYYGEVFTHDDGLRISRAMLHLEQKFFLNLSIDGVNSPLRTSNYEIALTENDLNSSDLNKFLTIVDENIYNYEVIDRLGKTERERTNAMLGRITK